MLYRAFAALLSFLGLLGCLASAQDGPGKGAQARTAWLYSASGKNGSFRNEIGKKWVERGPDGGEARFEEVERADKYVELLDRGRAMSLRLYSDHAEWRQGQNGPWNRLYEGRWAAAGDLPNTPKRDSRIRLAYFVPADRQPAPDYEKRIRVLIHLVSEVYRQDLEARRVRSEGLRFEAKEGQPVVHLIRGERTAAFYNNAPNYDAHIQWQRLLPEIPRTIGAPTENLIILFAETYDGGPAKYEWPGGIALGSRLSTDGGVGVFSAWVLRPEFCATTVDRQKQLLFDATPIKGRTAFSYGKTDSPRFAFIGDGFGAVTHELGHALGLPHDRHQDNLDIMGNGFRNLRWNFTGKPDPRRARFSDDNARILYSSPYLAPDVVSADRIAPIAKLGWATPLKVGATRINVSVTATDDVGLRAISFFSPAQDSVVGGQELTGKQQEFEQALTVQPLKPGAFRLEALVTDVGGNLTRVELNGTVER
jgi:hypothetical protein